MLARIEAGEARLYSRNGHDWTGKLGGVASALSKLEADHAWLDGEVVVLDAHGISSFQALQNAFERRSDSGVLYFNALPSAIGILKRLCLQVFKAHRESEWVENGVFTVPAACR